jgi:hypothetical protein
MYMLRKTVFLMLAAPLVALLITPEARAWGRIHVGYTHVGYGGAYHYGRTVGVGRYGGAYSFGHVGGIGAYGGSYHAGYGGVRYGYGGVGGYDAYSPYGATSAYRYGGYHYGGVYGTGYAGGVYRAW